jgi:hypothetical protein
MVGWVQVHILFGYGRWNAWLGPPLLTACIVAALLLVLGRLGVRLALSDDFAIEFGSRISFAIVLFCVVALLPRHTAAPRPPQVD